MRACGIPVNGFVNNFIFIGGIQQEAPITSGTQ